MEGKCSNAQPKTPQEVRRTILDHNNGLKIENFWDFQILLHTNTQVKADKVHLYEDFAIFHLPIPLNACVKIVMLQTLAFEYNKCKPIKKHDYKKYHKKIKN
jgi:hypothetical protein